MIHTLPTKSTPNMTLSTFNKFFNKAEAYKNPTPKQTFNNIKQL